MTSSIGRRRFTAIAACLALTVLSAPPAFAADADPAVGRIRSFHETLLESMKAASQHTPVRTRYDRLEPAVRATFDLAAMTRIAIGPSWTTIPAADQQSLVDQFSRLTIATYANRFDGWSGERFEVEPATEARGANMVVKSRLVRTKGDPIALNYLVHPTADGPKVIDVYLSGTISELATRRSEFGTILKNDGPSALVDSLKQRADRMLQPG